MKQATCSAPPMTHWRRVPAGGLHRDQWSAPAYVPRRPWICARMPKHILVASLEGSLQQICWSPDEPHAGKGPDSTHCARERPSEISHALPSSRFSSNMEWLAGFSSADSRRYRRPRAGQFDKVFLDRRSFGPAQATSAAGTRNVLPPVRNLLLKRRKQNRSAPDSS